MNYIDDLNQPLIKARVAKEIGENELFLCEIIVENILQDLDYIEIASVLSGFVNQFKPRKVKYDYLLEEFEMDIDEVWSDKFKVAAKKIYNISRNITKLEMKNGVVMLSEQEIDQYLFDNILNFSLAKVIYYWAKGDDFGKIVQFSEAQEGVIVRTILRLENMLKNIKSAAKIIGNTPLYNKIDKCQ